MGPTTRAISVTGGVTFDELRQNYYDQARALVDGGVDAAGARNLAMILAMSKPVC